MVPKDQGEASYVLRVPRLNARFVERSKVFKYDLRWPDSWELKEKGGQPQLRDNKARGLTCYLPGCVTALMSTSTQRQPFRRSQAEARKGHREIQASNE